MVASLRWQLSFNDLEEQGYGKEGDKLVTSSLVLNSVFCFLDL